MEERRKNFSQELTVLRYCCASFITYDQIEAPLPVSKMIALMEVRKKQRVAIDFLTMEEVQLVKVHRRRKNVYGTSAIDGSTFRRWTSRVKARETDLEDAMQLSPCHCSDTKDFALSALLDISR